MRQLSLILLASLLLMACGSTPVRVAKPLPALAPEFALKPLWQVDVGIGVEQRHMKLVPIVDGNILYVVDNSGTLLVLDADTGKRHWKSRIPVKVSAGLGIGGGQLYVASADGEVLALDIKDGQLLWRALVSSEVLAPPVYAQSALLIHTSDGKLFALDPSSGRVIWTYDRSVPILSLRGTSTPVVQQGTVFDTFGSGKLAIMQLSDGKVLFERPLGFASGRSDLDRINDADSGPLLDKEVIYTSTYQGSILAMNLRTGAELWNRKASIHQALSMDEQLLYAVDSDDTVWALNKNNGVPVWKQDALTARLLTAPVLFGDYLLVGDYQGNLHVLSRQDGHFVTRYEAAISEHSYNRSFGGLQVTHPRDKLGILSTPLVVKDKVYIYSRNGRLTALQIPQARQ